MAETIAAKQGNAGRVSLQERATTEIRAWMGRLRLSQKDLAEMLGVSQTQVSARLRGRMEFSLSEIETLAGLWGIDPLDLLAPGPVILPPASRELGQKRPLTRANRRTQSKCIPPRAHGSSTATESQPWAPGPGAEPLPRSA